MSARADENLRRRLEALIGREITAVDPVDESAQRLKVRAGRRVVAVLSRREVERLSLRPGTLLDETLAEAIMQSAAFDAALRAAMRLLARRPFARAELMRRLEKGALVREAVKGVMEHLAGLGLIDDEAFAREALAQLTRRTPAGARLREQTLARHGVEPETARRILAEHSAQVDAEADARHLISARLAAMRSLAPPAAARRLLALLARRGFDEELAQRLVHEAIGPLE